MAQACIILPLKPKGWRTNLRGSLSRGFRCCNAATSRVGDMPTWVGNGARRRPAEFEKRLAHFIKMTAENKQFGFGGIDKYY